MLASVKLMYYKLEEVHEKPLVGKNHRLNSSSGGRTNNYGISYVFPPTNTKTYAFYGIYTCLGVYRMHLTYATLSEHIRGFVAKHCSDPLIIHDFMGFWCEINTL